MYYRPIPYEWFPYNNYMLTNNPNTYTGLNSYHPQHFMYAGLEPLIDQFHPLINEFPYKNKTHSIRPPIFPGEAYNYNLFPPPIKQPFLSYFHDKNGNFDLNKMLATVGQVSSTIKQVSPLLKQFGTFLGKI